MEIKVKAYAKINLMLDILSLLPNGYHDLFMIMQSVSLFDTVTVKETDSQDIDITCTVPGIPLDEKNIAHKAATAFFNYTEIDNPGISIRLEKHIPHAAGLAGGSADGAAVIFALDKLFGTKLRDKELIKIGEIVGSDVPFCLLGGTMMAQYTGTILSHLPSYKENYIIIVKPDQGVNTGEAYRAFDTAEKVRHLDTKGMLTAVIGGDKVGIYQRVGNVFEQFIDVPDRTVIKSIMRNHGCECTCMSGSGPSVFGIFSDKDSAENCLKELLKQFPESYLCHTTDVGCEVDDNT